MHQIGRTACRRCRFAGVPRPAGRPAAAREGGRVTHYVRLPCGGSASRRLAPPGGRSRATPRPRNGVRPLRAYPAGIATDEKRSHVRVRAAGVGPAWSILRPAAPMLRASRSCRCPHQQRGEPEQSRDETATAASRRYRRALRDSARTRTRRDGHRVSRPSCDRAVRNVPLGCAVGAAHREARHCFRTRSYGKRGRGGDRPVHLVAGTVTLLYDRTRTKSRRPVRYSGHP